MSAVPSTSLPAQAPEPIQEPTQASRRRPFGLYAIIGIQVLTMLLSVALLTLLAVGLWLGAEGSTYGIEEMDLDLSLSWFENLSLIVMVIINPICAVGLWRRQRWAWLLSMLQLGFFMLGDLYSYFTGNPLASYAWSMLLNVGMVFYLNQRDVQALFLTGKEQQKP